MIVGHILIEFKITLQEKMCLGQRPYFMKMQMLGLAERNFRYMAGLFRKNAKVSHIRIFERALSGADVRTQSLCGFSPQILKKCGDEFYLRRPLVPRMRRLQVNCAGNGETRADDGSKKSQSFAPVNSQPHDTPENCEHTTNARTASQGKDKGRARNMP